jgi:hypothetical protein
VPHAFPAAHDGHVPPPQSIAVSLPFFTPSLQLAGAVQKPPTQVSPLTQLASPMQRFPVGHSVQLPPQSTSDSLPFFTPSLHDAATQNMVGPQESDWQSAPTRHWSPTKHGVQPPPQSMSVSVPFFFPSLQLDDASHFIDVHDADAQSLFAAHPFPAPHVCPVATQPAPQSTSVSPPFFTPSAHVGAAHALAVQTPDVQSAPIAHLLPFAQAPHGPPQSTSVSLPSETPSLHVGIAQSPIEQYRSAQSAFTLHARRSRQPGQPPPQSVLVSGPLSTPSVHDGDEHVLLEPHTPLAQSPLIAHPFASAHGAHEPPQSTSVSVPCL